MTLPRRAVPSSGMGGRGYRRLGTSSPTLPSVTTVLKNEAKPAIAQWAANQTAAFAVANAERLLGMSDAKSYGFLQYFWKREPKDALSADPDLAGYHETVLQDASELGDSVHEWIEASLFSTSPFPNVADRNERFWQCVEQFDAWRDTVDLKPHRTEVTVWDEREDIDGLGYAGTFDLQAEIDGEMYLIDVKTSRGLYSSTWMQLAALYNARYLLQEGPDGRDQMLKDWQKPIQKLAVLHVRPDDVNYDGSPRPAFCKLVPMPYEQERFFQSFMGLRAYAEGLKGMKL